MAIALDLGSYNDIRDYTSLLDRVRLWLDRGNELDALLPTFVANTENTLNRLLRCPEMEVFLPVSASGGAFTLPTDCLQVRSLTAGGRPLRAASPAALYETYSGPNGLRDGITSAFAITGRQVQVAPLSDATLTLTYWQRTPTLSQGQPTNWLLDGHADIYLYGALFQANTYIVDKEAAIGWSALFDNAVAALQDVGIRARYGGPIVARASVAPVRGVRA